MRKYDFTIEQNIRLERLTREWMRSNLLDREQCDRILAELPIPVRQTNVFLRVILFVFTTLIIVASVLLTRLLLNAHEDGEIAVLCFVWVAVTFAVAEYIVVKFHLYRFGVEEAAALSSAALAGMATTLFFRDRGALGFAIAAASAWLVYFRFGYGSAALGAMLCIGAIPFRLDLSGNAARLVSAAALFFIWFVAEIRRRRHGDEFPGDEYSFVAAMAWIATYAFLNLQLISAISPLGISTAALSPSPFYWFTYVMTWLLPGAGLYFGIRDKHRAMLDVNLALALVTLLTNKPYLHGIHKPWDPILFGLLLIGTAVIAGRWLRKGEHGVQNGFTAARILNSERRRVALAGMASVALHHDAMPHESSSPETYQPGGGRSGGAGASGSF